MDEVLKSIIKRQIPFLIGGYVISYLVSKYYYKSKGINDQKYLIQYGLSKIKSRKRQL